MKRHSDAHETAASNRFAFRCYIMAIAWVAVGLALTWYSYNQRMVVIASGQMSVIHNEQGMLAGYASMAFGAVWLVVGIVSALRGKSASSG